MQIVFRKLLQQKLVRSRECVESVVARLDGPERMPKTILVASKCRIIYQSVHVEVLAREQESDKEA